MARDPASVAPIDVRVGVVVVSHMQDYLADCLRSVLSQTRSPDRVIVVDNASPRDAPVTHVAEQFGLESLRLSAPRSLATARNVGCAILDDCEFIASLDGDDEWKPSYLETYLNTAQQRRADVVFGAAELFGAEEGVWFSSATRPPRADLRRGNFVPANSLFRRELWWLSRGFDHNLAYFEDWDFWLSCAEHSATFSAVEEPLWRYRRHHRSMLTTSDKAGRDEARRYIRKKHLAYIWGPLKWRRWSRNFEKYILRKN